MIQKNFSPLQKPGVCLSGRDIRPPRVKSRTSRPRRDRGRQAQGSARARSCAREDAPVSDRGSAGQPDAMLRASNPDLWAEVAMRYLPHYNGRYFLWSVTRPASWRNRFLQQRRQMVVAKKPPKLHVPYTPPATPPLAPITDTFTIKCQLPARMPAGPRWSRS